ncbi:MAG: hypothetical protein IJ575_04425 [Selenomonadaceae bacterium]|nr:hypothetical protein [Selenomonadaceae bacterium]
MDGLQVFAEFMLFIAILSLIILMFKRGDKDPSLRFCAMFVIGYDLVRNIEWESMSIIDMVTLVLVILTAVFGIIDRIIAFRSWRKNRG